MEIDPEGNRTGTVYSAELRAVNEALLVSSIRQHELTELAQRAHDKYHRLFESIDEGFCIIESVDVPPGAPIDFRYVEANPAFVVQSGIGDVVGKTIRGLFPGITEDWFATYDDVLRTGAPIRFERILEPAGRVLELYAFRADDPDRPRVAVIFKDITERTELQRRLKEQSDTLVDLHRRKDEFLAMLSHELRNPLAPISNAVHLLRLQAREDPLQLQARTMIERQLGQMTRLVDDLMEVSRITTGRVHLRQDRVAVAGIVERAVETASPILEQRRHELTVSVPEGPIWLFGDAGRLEQVVVNLLTNAAKYTEEGGRVWLTASQEGDEAVIRVRDTGVGIAPELLPRVFDLFTQAERSLDRAQGGLGIGLALVQRLVEMHRGKVEAFSAMGQGSEFVVRLPILGTPIPLPPIVQASAPTAGGALRILVVDDNVDSAESLAMLLQTVGHEVQTAHDGPTGLTAALGFRPDAVLLDIGLPKMDGYEVARKIRLAPRLAATPLIALTGYGQESDRQRSREAGFDHHLVKPVDFEKLLRILATVAKPVG